MRQYQVTQDTEANANTTQWVGWAIYAGIALAGFIFGVWVGNQRPNTVIETAKVTPKEDINVPEKPTPKINEKPEPAEKASKKEAPSVPVTPKKEPPVTVTPAPKKDVPPMVTPSPEPKKPVTPPAATQVSFATQVQPIFKQKCMLCHGDTKGPKGGLDLRTLTSIEKGGDSGNALIPMNLKDSSIWKWIDEGDMPPPKSPQLTDNEKLLIKNWILSGGK